MQGRRNVTRPRARARLLEPVDKIKSLRFFARGIYDADAGTVTTTGPQGSGILRSMSLANCLIDLAEGRERYRSEEHTSELQSLRHLVCRLLLEKKKKQHKK